MNAACVLTPTGNSKSDTVKALDKLWQSVGARVMTLSPEVHDEFVSRSSHLPHVVAAELANYVLSPAHPREQGLLCANGFRDTTRIASGSPEMWRDIAWPIGRTWRVCSGCSLKICKNFNWRWSGPMPRRSRSFSKWPRTGAINGAAKPPLRLPNDSCSHLFSQPYS